MKKFAYLGLAIFILSCLMLEKFSQPGGCAELLFLMAGTLSLVVMMILISEDCYGHPLAEIHQVCLEYLEKLSQMNSQDR